MLSLWTFFKICILWVETSYPLRIKHYRELLHQNGTPDSRPTLFGCSFFPSLFLSMCSISIGACTSWHTPTYLAATCFSESTLDPGLQLGDGNDRRALAWLGRFPLVQGLTGYCKCEEVLSFLLSTAGWRVKITSFIPAWLCVCKCGSTSDFKVCFQTYVL